jgi:hypothetical protein
MKVMIGEEVKWLSRANYNRWLKGKVVRVLESGAVAVIDDRLGQSLRCVDTLRLQPLVERRQRFAGSLA